MTDSPHPIEVIVYPLNVLLKQELQPFVQSSHLWNPLNSFEYSIIVKCQPVYMSCMLGVCDIVSLKLIMH